MKHASLSLIEASPLRWMLVVLHTGLGLLICTFPVKAADYL